MSSMQHNPDLFLSIMMLLGVAIVAQLHGWRNFRRHGWWGDERGPLSGDIGDMLDGGNTGARR